MDDILETIVLSTKEYKRLLEDSKLLAALEAAGVDNWDGYEDALEYMED